MEDGWNFNTVSLIFFPTSSSISVGHLHRTARPKYRRQPLPCAPTPAPQPRRRMTPCTRDDPVPSISWDGGAPNYSPQNRPSPRLPLIQTPVISGSPRFTLGDPLDQTLFFLRNDPTLLKWSSLPNPTGPPQMGPEGEICHIL